MTTFVTAATLEGGGDHRYCSTRERRRKAVCVCDVINDIGRKEVSE